MKQFLLYLCILTATLANAQKRYYPSLRSLLNLQEESKFTTEFKYVEKWYRATTDGMFYTSLQQSSSAREDANFRRLGIIPRGDKQFQFLDSGFEISFNKSVEDKETPIFLINNNIFPIYAYTGSFSLNTFDPNNNVKLFFLLKLLNKLTDEQALAHFINTFTEPEKDETPIKKFIKDINAANNIDIDEDLFENSDATLKGLCSKINKQMPNSDCPFSAYKAYLEIDSDQNTRKNIDRFYKNITPIDIENIINDNILPYGNFEFLDKTVAIHLPQKYFKYDSKKSKNEAVSFLLRDLKYDLNYSFQKNGYVYSIKLYPQDKNEIKDSFEFKHKYRSILTGKDVTEKVTLLANQLKLIEIVFYEDHLKVYVETNDDTQMQRQRFELYQKISITVP